MPRNPIVIGSSRGRSLPLNAARLVNLYAEKAPEGSISPIVLYGTPGQKAFASLVSADIRAARFALGGLYVLCGATLFRVDADGGAITCTGDAISASGDAMMSDNGLQLVVLSNKESFVVVGTTVTKIVSAGYPAAGASSVDYIDGYTVWTEADSSRWFISDLLDASTIDPLDFATAESSPDGLLRVLVDHREVWLFGTDTIEPWNNTGASPFPFERVSGALLERGCGAALSPAKMDNSVFWLGNDRIVYKADGYQPVRISDHGIEEILRTGTIADAYGMTYAQGGHHFYVLTLPSKGRTLVFDAATMRWHERQSGTSLVPAQWDVRCLVPAYGKTLAGLPNGIVAELDLDTFSDLGEPIRSVACSMPLYADGNGAIGNYVQLECELGVGLTSGQGSDPTVMLRVSDDGGLTWGNEKRASLGPKGVRRKRAQWNRLGMFRGPRVHEFSISDPVKRAIYGARYEVEGLAH